MTDTTTIETERQAMIQFEDGYNHLALLIHNTAVEKGWWDKPEGYDRMRDLILAHAEDHEQLELLAKLKQFTKRNEGEILMLVTSEVVEALESLRKGNPPDNKLPGYDGVSVELADAIIRIMDYGVANGYKVAEALTAKLLYNRTREYKHGGKKF